MFKIIVSSLALLLLIGSGATADIIQGQTWGVGSVNDLLLQQSQQSANSSQNVLINMSQNTGENGLGLTSAHVMGSSNQFGFSGLFGTSVLSSHAQMLSIGGGLHMPLGISPIGSTSLLQGLVLLGH